jgi:plasmid stability protein
MHLDSAITASIPRVAQLLVRDIEAEVVRELKLRAASHGRSAEEEHREILRAALGNPGPKSSLKELLLEMPEGDLDLERPLDYGRPPIEF